jgi:hypothetical protein
MPKAHATTKIAVLARVRSGEMGIPEAAYVFDLDRMTVWRWCQAEGIDAAEARRKWLIARRREIEHGRSHVRGNRSKRAMRAEIAAALSGLQKKEP